MKVTPQAISKAVNVSFAKFAHFRIARGRFLSQMVGRFYNKSRGKGQDREDKKASPLNLLHSAVTTLVPNLVYNDPKVRSSTDIIMYRDYADMLGLATNHLVGRIGLRMTLRKAIYDAVFMAGFIKTGLATGDQFITIEGNDIEIGQPYAERVDPDDMILDPMARDWDEQEFIGNRYRANLADLEASGLYDMDRLRKLSNRYDNNDMGEAEKLGGEGYADKYREVNEYVDLCEVYLPKEQLVVTLPYQKDYDAEDFIRVADHMGPDTGPYHMLGFTPVSDNILPIPPAAIWYDLHILGNRIARKLARQAERLKRVLAYEGSASDDVGNIAESDDGETVRVDDVDKMKELTFGGAAPESYEWMEWVKRHFSEQAGNLDMLSGTGSNVATATQAEMLQANTSVRLADMQGSVYDFTARVTRDLAFFLHTDPLIELPLVRRVQGVETQAIYTPEMRRGDFFDYTIKIEPYSMARPDPNMAVRRRLEFATNVIPAAANAFMMLGPGFNVGAFLKRMAIDVGIEDADEWLNDAAFQQWMMFKIQASSLTGDPGKAGGGKAPPVPGVLGGPAPMNPGQPNPNATGPTGGVSPDTEQAQAQQETGGELQSNRPSARALALQI